MNLPFRVEDSNLDEHPGQHLPPAGGPEGAPAPVGPPPVAAPAAPMTERRSWREWLGGLDRYLPRTLTNRLVLGVVSLLVLLIVLLSGSTYFALRSFLYGRLDTQLTQAASSNAVSIQRSFERPNDGTVQVYLVNTGVKLWFSVLKSDGEAVNFQPLNTSSFVLLSLTTEQRAFFIAHPNRRLALVSNGEPVRAESVALDDGNYVVVALSTREVHRTLSRLLLLEVITGVAVLALAAGLTSWGLRAGLRPLRRVTRTAQEVTAELSPDGSGLNRRVPVEGATIEVEEVASSVNTLLHAVEVEFHARVRSEERMRQFLADASHELRTPLTSIRGYAELSRLQSAAGEAADDAMRRIETEGNRMSRLVEDLLVLARGDQGSELHRDRVDVDDLLSDAAAVVTGAHPEREITVTGAHGLSLIGDWDQLLRVLINLATNSAVHTPAGPITLSAEPVLSPVGPAVALRVSDTGPGLPPDEAEHVFERFWRADKARSRAKGGSGLGMAIVAQITHAHGGWVHFESTVAGGTTVTVTIPVGSARPV